MEKYRTYTFTIKKNVSKDETTRVSELDYNDILEAIKKDAISDQFASVFETDSKGCMHVHGIVTLNKGVRYVKYKPRGYHVNFTDCFSVGGWLDYMGKDIEYAKKVQFKAEALVRLKDVPVSNLSPGYDSRAGGIQKSSPSRAKANSVPMDTDSDIDVGDDFMIPPKKLFPTKNIHEEVPKKKVYKEISTKGSKGQKGGYKDTD